MDDTVLRVAATLYGEAGVCGLAGMYAAAYVMASRMEMIGGGWMSMLRGVNDYAGLGGWSWYQRAESRSEIKEWLDDSWLVDQWLQDAEDAEWLAALMVRHRFDRRHLAALAVEDTGLQLPPDPLLYCMSQQDVDKNHWPDGDVVVYGPKPYALHLYAEYPGK